jgi:RNA polymerase sigma-70 factor (ECF subfamily)
MAGSDLSRSDESVIRNVLTGDVSAFRGIVERYQDMVFGIGMRFFRNEDDASDFAQEVFVRVYRNLGNFKERAPFRFWLIRLAYNYACSRSSVKKKDPVSLEGEIVSRDRAVDTEIGRREIHELLRKAVNDLPEEYRVCVDLYFYGGFSHAEISNITGLPQGTIKSHVYRAKRMLRDALKGTIAEDYNEM